MNQNPRLSVVIPVYNEADGIESVVGELKSVLERESMDFEILLVDDGSTDGSAEMIRRLAERHERFGAVLLPRNIGQHGALLCGLCAARGRIILTMDADGQHPPEEIRRLIAAIEQGNDAAGGIRANRKDPLYRRAVSGLLRLTLRMMTGANSADIGSMFRAYSRDVLERILSFATPTSFVPLLALRVAENPVEMALRHRPRAAGKTKYTMRGLIKLYGQLLMTPRPGRRDAGVEADVQRNRVRKFFASLSPAIILPKSGDRTKSAVVFAYQEVGHRCLEFLLKSKLLVSLVVTHEDDPSENRWFGSVEDLAKKHGIPVLKMDSPKDPALGRQIQALAPDIIFSFYYRQLIPASILQIPKLGAFNMHGSLLPKYRGRCPVNWALIHGESVTGMTLHEMVEKADAGSIVGQIQVQIDEQDSAPSLYRKMVPAAVQLLARTLSGLMDGSIERVPQDELQATKFGGRKPEDGLIDFSGSARQVYNLVRAVTAPYPGAFALAGTRKWMIWWAKPLARIAPRVSPGTVMAFDASSGCKIACGEEGALDVLECGFEREPPQKIHEFVLKNPQALAVGQRIHGKEILA